MPLDEPARRQRSRLLMAAPLVAAPLAAGAVALVHTADSGGPPAANAPVVPVAPSSPVGGLIGGDLGQPSSYAVAPAGSGTAAPTTSSPWLEVAALRTARTPVASLAPPAVGVPHRAATSRPPATSATPAGLPAVAPVPTSRPLPAAQPAAQPPAVTRTAQRVVRVVPATTAPVPSASVAAPTNPPTHPPVETTAPFTTTAPVTTPVPAQHETPALPGPSAGTPAAAHSASPDTPPAAAAKGRHRLPQGLHRAQGRHQG